MPRSQNAANPSLRNRNRVTNKTRLKVLKGNIDADPIVLDEDEERARVVSTAGVDAEDANEHHLQAVLSAASHRATKLAQRTRAASVDDTKKPESSTAFIPVPDANGVVENVDELYPSERWKDSQSYVKFSSIIDECVSVALADGFTYIMDERDSEWLSKNNQEARGEGTSSQASTAGTTTRSGTLFRSAKAKGKEADLQAPLAVAEDEFELVMGIFEKLTHDSTPFLHVSFQQQHGTSIPAFSDFQDTFNNELSPSYFATYMCPTNIPPPQTLVKIARAVYAHWRERKIEREGHRIIPTLNLDESDTKNESYICFRRREIKAIRKTRTAQVSSVDKLMRLRGELSHAYELSRNVLSREVLKRDAYREAKNVWERRMMFVDLKRKFPTFGSRDEEDLLFDKERVAKKPKATDQTAAILRIKNNRPNGDMSASPTPNEVQIRPKEKWSAIQAAIELFAKRMKEADHGWEDQIDAPYQQMPVSVPDRFFKFVRSDDHTTGVEGHQRDSLYLRLRRGRGGRMHIDRRRPNLRVKFGGADILRLRSRQVDEFEDTRLVEENLNRLAERWRYDSLGDLGADEEERTLLDDFNPKHLRCQAQLLLDQEHNPLSTDSRLYLMDPQTGSHTLVSPYRMSLTPRRDHGIYQRTSALPNGPQAQAAQPQPTAVQAPNAGPSSSTSTPLSSPLKIVPPSVPVHSRTPSNGPQRPSSGAAVAAGPTTNGASSSPPSQPTTVQVNGIASQKSPIATMLSATGAVTNGVVNGAVNGAPNGAANMVGFQNGMVSFGMGDSQGLAAQQTKQLNKVYANYSMPPGINVQRVGQAMYAQNMMNGMGGPNGGAASNVNMSGVVNMKIPVQRQMQWAAAQRSQQPTQNGNDVLAMQGIPTTMQQIAGMNGLMQVHAPPQPTMNGHISPQRNGGSNASSALSPPNSFAHLAAHAHSHSLIGSPAQAASQPSQAHVSPIRNMQTPVPPSPSPLLQHQLPNLVGSMSSQGQGF